MATKRKVSSEVEKRKLAYELGIDHMKDQANAFLRLKIDNLLPSYERALTRFLQENSRRERDNVIKKREQIKIYKELLNDELFQSAK